MIRLLLFCALPFTTPDGMLDYVKNCLPQDPVILEAGGHDGADTACMKAVWPNATLHVFEPLPASYEKLLRNTRGLAGVYCYPLALTSYSGTTPFYVDTYNPGASSIGAPVAFNCHEFSKEPLHVACTTLDDWAKERDIPNIDFMWLDMEGHELHMLKASPRLLNSVKAIYTEFFFGPVRQDTGCYADLKSFLESRGFREAHRMIMSNALGGEALFIKTPSRPK